ncbi:hypothetical protein, partial [Falsiroseomonas oryziterrae]|uniref:hypothetical protein n=1 Tax=Falsiroseomonas oryziterrae TaxID=2911368 RepID=UPI001F2321FF
MDTLSDSHPSAAGLRDLAAGGPVRPRVARRVAGLRRALLLGLAGFGALIALGWTLVDTALSDGDRRLQEAAAALARGAEDALAPAEALAALLAARLRADGIGSPDALQRWAAARPAEELLR